MSEGHGFDSEGIFSRKSSLNSTFQLKNVWDVKCTRQIKRADFLRSTFHQTFELKANLFGDALPAFVVASVALVRLAEKRVERLRASDGRRAVGRHREGRDVGQLADTSRMELLELIANLANRALCRARN